MIAESPHMDIAISIMHGLYSENQSDWPVRCSKVSHDRNKWYNSTLKTTLWERQKFLFVTFWGKKSSTALNPCILLTSLPSSFKMEYFWVNWPKLHKNKFLFYPLWYLTTQIVLILLSLVLKYLSLTFCLHPNTTLVMEFCLWCSPPWKNSKASYLSTN